MDVVSDFWFIFIQVTERMQDLMNKLKWTVLSYEALADDPAKVILNFQVSVW